MAIFLGATNQPTVLGKLPPHFTQRFLLCCALPTGEICVAGGICTKLLVKPVNP